jgi:hypothetical protein
MLLSSCESAVHRVRHCFARIFGDSRNIGHFNNAWLFTSSTLTVGIRLPSVERLFPNHATSNEIQFTVKSALGSWIKQFHSDSQLTPRRSIESEPSMRHQRRFKHTKLLCSEFRDR